MKKKIVIKTGIYVNGSSKREPIYCTEGGKRKVLEKLIKEKLTIPTVDFTGEGKLEWVDGVPKVKITKKPDTTAKAIAKALPVKITIEY